MSFQSACQEQHWTIKKATPKTVLEPDNHDKKYGDQNLKQNSEKIGWQQLLTSCSFLQKCSELREMKTQNALHIFYRERLLFHLSTVFRLARNNCYHFASQEDKVHFSSCTQNTCIERLCIHCLLDHTSIHVTHKQLPILSNILCDQFLSRIYTRSTLNRTRNLLGSC